MRCRKKVTYATRLHAKIALAMMAARDRAERRAYWCTEHQGYHLTSQAR